LSTQSLGVGLHGAYFRRRKFAQVEKMSTVAVDKIFALVVQYSEQVRIFSVVVT